MLMSTAVASYREEQNFEQEHGLLNTINTHSENDNEGASSGNESIVHVDQKQHEHQDKTVVMSLNSSADSSREQDGKLNTSHEAIVTNNRLLIICSSSIPIMNF
jgi:hypothetical protein